MNTSKKTRLESTMKLTTLSLISVVLSACSSAPTEEADPSDTMVGLTLEDEIYSFHTHQQVNDYTDRLAHDLFRNLRNRKVEQPILVTSFVTLDDTLKNSRKLGNLVSESLIGNMQEYDVPLMDVHLTGGIDITPTGDYVFSRNREEIQYSGEVTYVLSGVIVEGERGYTVNARIMELKTKRVISTATTFIPSYVVDVI